MKISFFNKFNSNKIHVKNTISANYNRCRTYADVGSLITIGQFARLSSWGIHDVGITSMFGTLAIKNISESLKLFKALKPIKARAKIIKELSKKNINTSI
jgi:hypothetical protein